MNFYVLIVWNITEKEDDTPKREEKDLITEFGKVESLIKEESEPLELPAFSSGVKTALSEGKSNEVWSQMIDELVMFYARKYPSRLKCSEDYQIVGRMMYSSYPTIGRFGMHPWVC